MLQDKLNTYIRYIDAGEYKSKYPNVSSFIIDVVFLHPYDVGFIRMMILKGQLTSVHKSESAADYTRDKSFRVDTKRDLFLYSKVDKKEKADSNKQ